MGLMPEAPYNGTLRRWVEEGLRDPCERKKCIVGVIAGEPVPMDEWVDRLEGWDDQVKRFNTSSEALPHPGFAFEIRYCSNCGNPVMEFHGQSPDDPNLAAVKLDLFINKS